MNPQTFAESERLQSIKPPPASIRTAENNKRGPCGKQFRHSPLSNFSTDVKQIIPDWNQRRERRPFHEITRSHTKEPVSFGFV